MSFSASESTPADLSVPVLPSCVQQALRLLHMLKIQCSPLNKSRHGNTQITHNCRIMKMMIVATPSGERTVRPGANTDAG